MKASKRATAIVSLGWAVVLWGSPSSAAETTVQWHVVANGALPPPSFALNPANPTTTNAISFIASTDGKTYGNSCFASVACGNPALTVDSANQTITVSFSPPLSNSVCPEIVVPVSGVDGQFGPLSAGTWVFDILQNSYTFSVTEAPIPLSIKALINASTFQLDWPVCGDPFVLEFNDGFAPGNWQVVTNSPTTSSNRNTVLICGSPGSRFFRLRRLNP